MTTTSKPPKGNKAAKAGGLTPIKLKAMDLMVSGMPLQEISETLGRTRQTLSLWKNQDPLFKSKLEELLTEAEDWRRAAMPMNDEFMMGQLRRLARDASPETSLKAIQWYFERFGRIDVTSDTDRDHQLLKPLSSEQEILARVLSSSTQSRRP